MLGHFEGAVCKMHPLEVTYMEGLHIFIYRHIGSFVGKSFMKYLPEVTFMAYCIIF